MRMFSKLLRFLLLAACVHAIGIVVGWFVFFIVFHVFEPGALPVDAVSVWMSFGLCLLVFSVRGVLVVIPIAALLAFRPAFLTAVIATVISAAAFWFLLGNAHSVRDQSLVAGGALGYGVAAFIVQRFITRSRRLKPAAEAGGEPSPE